MTGRSPIWPINRSPAFGTWQKSLRTLFVSSHIKSVYRLVSGFIKDPYLRQVFSFHPLLIGGNPFQSSSIYSMIHYLERKWGVHFAMGGTGAIVDGLLSVFAEMGGVLHLNSRAAEITTDAAGAASGWRPARRWPPFPGGVVVSNGDVANTYRHLLPSVKRQQMDGSKARTNAVFDGFVRHLLRNESNLPESGSSHDHSHATVSGIAPGHFSAQAFGRRFFALLAHAHADRPEVGPPGRRMFLRALAGPEFAGGRGLGSG